MAISKTTVCSRIEVSYDLSEAGNHILHVLYLETFDDPDDDQLPVISKRYVTIERYDTEGNATDYSNQDQKVIDICDIVFS